MASQIITQSIEKMTFSIDGDKIPKHICGWLSNFVQKRPIKYQAVSVDLMAVDTAHRRNLRNGSISKIRNTIR